MPTSRRRFLQAGLAGALASRARFPEANTIPGAGRLVIGILQEPTMLTSGLSTDGAA